MSQKTKSVESTKPQFGIFNCGFVLIKKFLKCCARQSVLVHSTTCHGSLPVWSFLRFTSLKESSCPSSKQSIS